MGCRRFKQSLGDSVSQSIANDRYNRPTSRTFNQNIWKEVKDQSNQYVHDVAVCGDDDDDDDLCFQAFNGTIWIRTESTYATNSGWRPCLAKSQAKHC